MNSFPFPLYFIIYLLVSYKQERFGHIVRAAYIYMPILWGNKRFTEEQGTHNKSNAIK